MSQKNTELTKEIIIEAARSIFVEKGFQDVSMRGIARQLGCSHGALYYHFKNKADLFYAIVEADFSKLNHLLDGVIQGSEDDATKLRHIFLRFIEFGIKNQHQYEIMFIIRNTEVDGLSQKAASLSYQKFAQSVQHLTIKKLAVKDVWSAFLAVHGFIAHYRGYVSEFKEVELAAKSHVEFILKSLIE